MPRSEAAARDPIDWRGWVALAWAAWFGLLYGRMVLEERAPTVLATIGRAADSVKTWCR
jgi:hypothetical protein